MASKAAVLSPASATQTRIVARKSPPPQREAAPAASFEEEFVPPKFAARPFATIPLFAPPPPNPPEKPLPLQRKLSIGATNDPLEYEADRIAAQIMQTPPDAASTHRIHSGPHAIARSALATPTEVAAPPSVHRVLSTPGQPLDAASRSFMEPRFGHDFGKIRIHHDNMAAQSAKDVDARAYTIGNHMVFGYSQFSPATASGRTLLAHELTHTLQQSKGQQVVQRWVGDVLSHGNMAPPPAESHEAAEPVTQQAQRYNLELVVPHLFLTNAKTYSHQNQDLEGSLKALDQFGQMLRDILDNHRGLHRELIGNREEHDTVGFWADALGGVDIPDIEEWTDAQQMLYKAKLMVGSIRALTSQKGGVPSGHNVPTVQQAGAMLQMAADEIGKVDAELIEYKDGTEKGAERGITVCKVTIVALSTAAGGSAFQGAIKAGYGLYGASAVTAGVSAATAEANEIGGQVGEMRYGDRKWGDFDWKRIGKVGAKSAVTGFLGAVAGGKLTGLIGPSFARFMGPRLASLGFAMNGKAMNYLTSIGENWLVTVASTPFTTSAGVVMDKIMGDQTVSDWGEYFELVLHDTLTGLALGTLMQLGESAVSGTAPRPIYSTEPPTPPASSPQHALPAPEPHAAASPASHPEPHVASAAHPELPAHPSTPAAPPEHTPPQTSAKRSSPPKLEVHSGGGQGNKTPKGDLGVVEPNNTIRKPRVSSKQTFKTPPKPTSPGTASASRPANDNAFVTPEQQKIAVNGAPSPHEELRPSASSKPKGKPAAGAKPSAGLKSSKPVYDEPLTPAERKLTPEQLRQKYILELMGERQADARETTKREAETSPGRPTGKAGAGMKALPKHHVYPQELRAWFEQRGFTGRYDIDNFTVELSESDHQAIHGGGNYRMGRTTGFEWNTLVDAQLTAAEQAAGRMLTRPEITNIVQNLMGTMGIPRNFVPYR